METINEIWGQGKDLGPLQMSVRAAAVFIIGLVLIRFTGRRSFGMRMPFDNVITILLGALLSAGITGVAPFWSVIAAATTLSALHRLFAWICLRSHSFGSLVKGNSRLLFKDGRHVRSNMKRAFLTDEDLIEGIRLTSSLDDLGKIKEVYMERDGQISVVKKT